MLVEFAFIALAFYLLFAGTIELGRMIAASQALQNAARTGARELALVPLPATATFRDALSDPRVRQNVYDPALLAVPIQGGVIPSTAGWPVINRMLSALMIVERFGPETIWHYPGAVVRDAATNELTVAVPVVLSRDGDGTETIRWSPVVEEVVADPADPDSGPFSLTSTGPQRGLVALRINYPYQATSLIAYRPQQGPGAPFNQPILVDEEGVQVEGPDRVVLASDDDTGAYAGRYSLGKFYAHGTAGAGGVRPFRRLISQQSIFRREVYGQ